MAEQENSKDLISVLWSGADILRSKMDANEYKNYLLGIVFYKYLSDSMYGPWRRGDGTYSPVLGGR